MVKRPHSEDKDLGSNPAANEKRTLGDPLQKVPNGPASSEWKISDIKLL